MSLVMARCTSARLTKGVEGVKSRVMSPLVRSTVHSTSGTLEPLPVVAYRVPVLLDTLAAAYAESGDFERAITTQRRALALVEGRELLPQLVKHLENHLALYEAGEPLRLP